MYAVAGPHIASNFHPTGRIAVILMLRDNSLTELNYAVYEHVGFCAARDLMNFSTTPISNKKNFLLRYAILPEDVFKTLVNENMRRGMLFMGDKKWGVIDTLVFPSIPKKSWESGGFRISARLSKYFVNYNTGNKVRYCTVIMETIPTITTIEEN